MALTVNTEFSNRYGLNVGIYAVTDIVLATPLMTIDFANICDIDISGERTWATGGQAHANRIGFNDPIKGTFKISTQIMTMEILNLMSGGTAGAGTTTVVFENTSNSAPKYYIIKADTVWQDDAGVTYTETMTFHKACPKRALNISYNGDGDPTSVDIEFDLMQDADEKVLTITKAEQTASAS